MTRMRLILLAMLAALAVSAVASVASASAFVPEWLVELLSLGATEKKTIFEGEYESLIAAKAYILETPNLEISCKFLKVNGGFIEGKTNGGATSLEFLTCTAPKAPKCVVANVTTVPVTATLETPAKPVVKFKPSGGEFTTIATSGTGCVLPKAIKVTGTATGTLLTPSEDLVPQAIEFNGTLTNLKAAGEVAEFLGEPDLELVGKPLWSVG